jgi:hypothetical protein
VLQRGIVGLALLATVVGGAFILRAVDRLDEAWARDVVVHGEMADLEAIVRARLDEASGGAGIDGRSRTSDADLRAQLDELISWADADAADLVEVVLAREGELREDVEATGEVDERLLVGVHSALRELDREVVRPVGERARAEHDTARRTVIGVLLALSVLWVAALFLSGRLRGGRWPVGVEGRDA